MTKVYSGIPPPPNEKLFYTFQIDVEVPRGYHSISTNASNRRDKLRNMEADEFEENRD